MRSQYGSRWLLVLQPLPHVPASREEGDKEGTPPSPVRTRPRVAHTLLLVSAARGTWLNCVACGAGSRYSWWLCAQLKIGGPIFISRRKGAQILGATRNLCLPRNCTPEKKCSEDLGWIRIFSAKSRTYRPQTQEEGLWPRWKF